MKVDCADTGMTYELSEYFTFKVPGAEFMPTYRNRMWDGKIRLFNMWNKSLYVGLTHKLEEFCKERGYELLGLDDILNRNKFTIQDVVKEITDLICQNSKVSKKLVYNYCLKLKNEN